MTGVCLMRICMDKKPENCNHCIYRENISRHLDMEDYCSLNRKRIGKIDMKTDCPLRKSIIRKRVMKIFTAWQNRREAERKTEDIIQMKTNLLLTDKNGKFIEVKVPEPEYIHSIW